MLLEIKKNDIPDWDYGDVCVKSYSYGDLTKFGELTATIKTIVEKVGTKQETSMEAQGKDNVDLQEINMLALAAGIHYIRNADNLAYYMNPNTETNVKKSLVYNVSKDAALYLLEKIAELNKPLDRDQKKN